MLRLQGQIVIYAPASEHGLNSCMRRLTSMRHESEVAVQSHHIYWPSVELDFVDLMEFTPRGINKTTTILHFCQGTDSIDHPSSGENMLKSDYVFPSFDVLWARVKDAMSPSPSSAFLKRFDCVRTYPTSQASDVFMPIAVEVFEDRVRILEHTPVKKETEYRFEAYLVSVSDATPGQVQILSHERDWYSLITQFTCPTKDDAIWIETRHKRHRSGFSTL